MTSIDVATLVIAAVALTLASVTVCSHPRGPEARGVPVKVTDAAAFSRHLALASRVTALERFPKTHAAVDEHARRRAMLARTPAGHVDHASPADVHAWRQDFYASAHRDPRLNALLALVGYRWTHLPTTALGLLAALNHFEQRGDRVVQVRDFDGDPTKGEVHVDILDLTNADHRVGVPVRGLVDERELRSGGTQVTGDLTIGLAAEQAHKISPSLDGCSSPSVGVGLVGEVPPDSPTSHNTTGRVAQ